MAYGGFTGTIYYKDGRQQQVSGGAAALTAWEEYAHRNGWSLDPEQYPRMLSQLVIAHRLAAVDEGFEVWRETVDFADIDATDAIPPTQTVRSVAS